MSSEQNVTNVPSVIHDPNTTGNDYLVIVGLIALIFGLFIGWLIFKDRSPDVGDVARRIGAGAVVMANDSGETVYVDVESAKEVRTCKERDGTSDSCRTRIVKGDDGNLTIVDRVTGEPISEQNINYIIDNKRFGFKGSECDSTSDGVGNQWEDCWDF